MMTKDILQRVLKKQDLAIPEAERLLFFLTREETDPVIIGAILTALAAKGESESEIIGFIRGMRKIMVSVPFFGAIDVCGTGGDNSNTFNISTAVSFVVAGAGVFVAKHGNRAASSRCGSADVLEALGVNITLSSRQAEDVLEKAGIVFLFAPLFHPSFKKVGQVRKILSIPTIFNFLGPFTNPTNVTRQMIGVPTKTIAEKLARVAQKLAYKKLYIITSGEGLDELSLHAENSVYEINGSSMHSYSLHAKNVGLSQTAKQQLHGGDRRRNAEIITSILDKKRGGYRDIVVLNAAMALCVAGKVKTLLQGIAMAQESIDSGSAKEKLFLLQRKTQKYA